MKKFAAIIFTLSLLLALLAGACTAKPSASTPEEFFKANMVTLVVNGGVGGSTDFGGRVFGSYWAETTGGPGMPVKVMSGGGGIEGTTYVYSAKTDGLTIGMTHHPSDITSPKLLGTPGPTWDTSKLSWIGLFGKAPEVLYIGADSPYKTLDDLKKAHIKLGATNPGSSTSVSCVAAITLLGLDAEVIHGYEAAECALAVKRGEIQAYSTNAALGIMDVQKGLVKPFVTLTTTQSAWHPDTPPFTKLTQLTPDKQDMLNFLDAIVSCKSIFGPPGIPADKLAYMRGTFDKIMANAAFIKQIKNVFAVWEKPLTGQELETQVNQVLGMPKEKAEAVRQMVKKYIK